MPKQLLNHPIQRYVSKQLIEPFSDRQMPTTEQSRFFSNYIQGENPEISWETFSEKSIIPKNQFHEQPKVMEYIQLLLPPRS